MTDEVAPHGSRRAEGQHVQPRATGPISPLDEVSDTNFERSLSRVEDRLAARRMQKLQNDHDLLMHLQLSSFDVTSPEWTLFQNVLVEYGYSVFVGWGISGELRRRAAAHGRNGVWGLNKLPEGLILKPEQAHELAAELVMVSIVQFREKTLMNPDPARRWTVQGGASLKTFFVGRCLMELPDVYTKVRNHLDGGPGTSRAPVGHEHPSLRQLRPSTPPSAHSTGHGHTHYAALDAVAVAEMESADPRTVSMFRLQLAGYELAEIGEILGCTEGVVRTTMYRFRTGRNAS